MRVALAADHGGFSLRDEIMVSLQGVHEVLDLGAHRLDPNDDYPDIVVPLAQAIGSGEAERGIIVCGSGVGACIAVNKFPGVRACLCHDTYSAHQGVEHDDMNVLCLGGRVVGIELAKELVAAFLDARFSAEERFRRRLNKVIAFERKKQPK